jgi:hypothetical protein
MATSFASLNLLTLDVIIHVHQVADGVHIVGNVGVAMDGVLDHRGALTS